MPRDYGYGKNRTKRIGKYELIVEFYQFKKARFYIYLENKQVYWSVTDIVSNNKQDILELYKSLKSVKDIEQIIIKKEVK